MGLRLRLFLLFGVLMAALTVVQWLMVRQLTGRTLEEFAGRTLQVSRQLVDFFNREVLAEADAEPRANPSEGGRLEEDPAPRKRKILERVGGESHAPAGEAVLKEEILLHRGGESFGVSLESGPAEGGASLLSSGPGTFRLRVAGSRHEADIEVSSEAFQAGFHALSRRLLLGTLGILALGLVLGAAAAHRMLRPLDELVRAAGEISQGRWGLQVSGPGGGEIGQAIEAFNQMSRRLGDYERQRRIWQERKHLSDLGEVARSLAHTIRNPLNSLGLSLEELAVRCPPGNPEVEELTRSARLQIGRVDQWIRSFLALASGGGELESGIDLRALVQDIALEFVQRRGARIVIRESDFESLPALRGVEAEVRGMLQALVANAAEAAGEGGRVEIGARSRDGAVLIEVCDDGPGLAEEVRRRLFSPHVTTKPQGAGMGLYLTHRLARGRYGGGLDLSPGPRAGAVARLQLFDRQSSPEIEP